MARDYVKAWVAGVLAVLLLGSTVAIAAWSVHVGSRVEAASAKTFSGLRARDVRIVKKEGNAELSKYVPMGIFTFAASIVCAVWAIRMYNTARSNEEQREKI